jgi:hypothetical protein
LQRHDAKLADKITGGQRKTRSSASLRRRGAKAEKIYSNCELLWLWLEGLGHEKHILDIRNICAAVARSKGTGPGTLRTAIANAKPLDPNHE